MFDWIKKALIEKWAGRVIVLGLSVLGGVLVKYGVDQAVVSGFVQAAQDLLIALVPILISWLLAALRHKTALEATPPAKS